MSSCVVPVECGTPDGKTDGKIDGKIDYHGRRRFNSPLDPITAQLYRPFILDGRAPYKRRFEWTGERLADDVDFSEGGGGGGGNGDGAAGEDLYWKVLGTGAIGKSVSVGDNGDVTIRIPPKASETGGIAPHQRVVMERFQLEPSTRAAYEIFTHAQADYKAPGESAARAEAPRGRGKRGGPRGRGGRARGGARGGGGGGGEGGGGGGGGGGGDGNGDGDGNSDGDGDGGNGGSGDGTDTTTTKARDAILADVSAAAVADGDTATASLASNAAGAKAAGAAGGKKPKAPGPKKIVARAHRPAAAAVEQEYLNEIHVLGADFVIPADTEAHAIHDNPIIWTNEITCRKNKLEQIKAHGNYFVAVLGKSCFFRNVRPPPQCWALPRARCTCAFRRQEPSGI